MICDLIAAHINPSSLDTSSLSSFKLASLFWRKVWHCMLLQLSMFAQEGVMTSLMHITHSGLLSKASEGLTVCNGLQSLVSTLHQLHDNA